MRQCRNVTARQGGVLGPRLGDEVPVTWRCWLLVVLLVPSELFRLRSRGYLTLLDTLLSRSCRHLKVGGLSGLPGLIVIS